MGRYVVREAEEYYDMNECDARGYPVKKIRYTGVEYETTVNPDGDYVEMGPDGWEIHTLIGGRKPQNVYKQTRYDKDVERRGMFLYKKGSKKSILIECPYKDVKEAIIPDTVKTIERFAFDECFDLETIVIPPSVEKIASEAFVGTAGRGQYYRSVTITFTNEVKRIASKLIPDNTSKLGSAYTWHYLMDDVVIPDSVTEIEENAFSNMRLLDVRMSNSIEKMGTGVFTNSSVYTLTISESVWMHFRNDLLDGVKNIGFVEDGKKLLYYGWDKSPFERWDINRYTDIGKGVFANFKFEKEKLVIPSSIHSIGEQAFMGCTTLVSVQLPDTITYIGDEAFKDCENLSELNIPMAVPWLAKNTFEGCINLKLVLISRKLYKRSRWKFPETTEFLFYEDIHSE